MGHVFISHASENAEEANELVALIEAKGITAWIAPRDVRPGLDYSEELQRALEACVAFVVLVTADANSSPYVRAETEMAFSCNKPMLPVRFGDVAAAPGLAFFLKIRTWTNAYGPKKEAALARLVLELQTLTGTAPSWAPKVGPASPASPPPPPPAANVSAAPPPLASTTPAAKPGRNLLPLAVIGILLVAALGAGIYFFTRPAAQPPSGPNANRVAPAPAPTPTPTPAPAPQGYANELTDYGVAPQSNLEADVGTPTPLAIPVGVRVTTDEAQRMLADNRATAIDVLADAHTETLPGALYMPQGGTPGSFSDANQALFALQLSQATGGDTARPLIFFCVGARCWESYNAVLRANAAGYGQLYWYRGGLAAWQAAGLPLAPLPAPYTGGKE